VLDALPETRPRKRVASTGTEAETVRGRRSFFEFLRGSFCFFSSLDGGFSSGGSRVRVRSFAASNSLWK